MVNPIHLPLAIKHLIDKYSNSADCDRNEVKKFKDDSKEHGYVTVLNEVINEKERFIADLKELVQ